MIDKVVEFFVREGGRREIKLAAKIGEKSEELGVSATDNLMVDVTWRRRRDMLSTAE